MKRSTKCVRIIQTRFIFVRTFVNPFTFVKINRKGILAIPRVKVFIKIIIVLVYLNISVSD